jgi:hypothetical protein
MTMNLLYFPIILVTRKIECNLESNLIEGWWESELGT